MKNTIRKLYHEVIFRLSARNSPALKVYHRYLYRPKPRSLARFYDELSRLLPSVYVIQVGANDGITHDPIHKYIKRDAWAGLLIEPQDHVFRKKLFPLYRRNPQIRLENCAVAGENSLMELYRISFSEERWATGLSTFHRPTLEKKVQNGEIQRLARKYGARTPASIDDYIRTSRVETKSFDFLRSKHEIAEVDVLQIDAEGFDFEIIKMYDLSRHKPGVVVFESHHLDEAGYANTQRYFEANGYTLSRVKGDSIGIRTDYEPGWQAYSRVFATA